MAQPQARRPKLRAAKTLESNTFETDFWKDANLRKMWDDIVPGAPRRHSYTLTREAIELYSKSVAKPIRPISTSLRRTTAMATDRAALRSKFCLCFPATGGYWMRPGP